MTEDFTIVTDADGVRDFRQLRQNLRNVDGQLTHAQSAQGGSQPLVIQFVEDSTAGDPKPQAARIMKLANGVWQSTGTRVSGGVRNLSGYDHPRDTPVVTLPRVDLFGYSVISASQRHFAVLIAELPADPGIYPTGTVTAGSPALTTSISLVDYVGYQIVVCGAGTDGKPLATTISSATSTIATLADTAGTAVTDAGVVVVASSTAYVLERNSCGRLVKKRSGDSAVIKTVVNDFRFIGPLATNTLIGIEYQEGKWVPYKVDCNAFAWVWE